MSERDVWRELEALLPELEGTLPEGYTGQIVLHCNAGRVLKYDVNETRRPSAGRVELNELRRRAGGT